MHIYVFQSIFCYTLYSSVRLHSGIVNDNQEWYVYFFSLGVSHTARGNYTNSMR